MSAHAGAGNIHTRKIAEFVSGLTYEKIPAEAVSYTHLTLPTTPYV